MDRKVGVIAYKNTFIFKNDLYFGFQDLDILPVSVSHDSANACGYIIEKDRKKISMITDTGTYNKRMMDAMVGADVYFVEANHDPYMLRNGSYPLALKKRILSHKGHLSNADSGRLLGDVLQGEGEHVFLAHLSNENNTPRIAFNTVNDYLRSLGLDTDRDIKLTVANRYCSSGRILLP